MAHTNQDSPESCASCGVHDCAFNAEAHLSVISTDRTAWLLDEYVPEFDLTRIHHIARQDLFLTIWHTSLLGKHGYDWRMPKGLDIKTHPLILLRRSLALRHLPPGGKLQAVLEQFDRRLADTYARQLPYTVTKLVIWQNLLPFLELNKALGGRSYRILAWRAPRHVLHRLLDQAQQRWPVSQTLNDFRSAPVITQAEERAFAHAEQILTPSTALARLYPDQAVILPWHHWPEVDVQWRTAERQVRGGISFLGPVIARRGAYLVREVMARLQLPFTVVGHQLEGADLFRGLDVRYVGFDTDWLDQTELLLAPALTDFRPRAIIQALSRGIPVIAGEWCGLPPHPLLHLIDVLDEAALEQTVRALWV